MRVGALAIGLLTAVQGSAQIFLGQVDTFTDGTVMNWGGAAMPTNIPDGGPNGAGDPFLQITCGVFGSSPHLATHNSTQWAGNYNAQGVKVIEADLRNQGATQLEIRLVLMTPLDTRFTSTQQFYIPPDNQWRHYAFPTGQAYLTRVYNGESYSTLINNVGKMMFRHDTGGPSSGGTVVQAQMGIDNITASAYAIVKPSSFSYQRGSSFAGGLMDLFESDDSRLVSRPGVVFSVTEAPIRIELTGTAYFTPQASLKFILESNASAPNVIQKISLYNYTTLVYDELDSAACATSDSVREVTVTSGISSYVNNSTKEMKALVSFKATGAVFIYPWLGRIDRAVWQLNP
jgi:hypothetical protein